MENIEPKKRGRPPQVKPQEPEIAQEKTEETVTITKTQFDDIQSKLKMLYEVADKGRVFNYESQRSEKKPMQVKLSVHEGNIVVGWRTVKDVLIKNPSTGLTVGEEQQYELLLMDEQGGVNKLIVNGYARFSDVRYTERIDCTVVGKKESFDGSITFTVQLPSGREIELDARYIN